ncbi:MAG: peptidylprolyl isomerase [Chloroflexota bacterium]|nr:peptidylprolyl isomerase [Ardenticatenaceae bacterium]
MTEKALRVADDMVVGIDYTLRLDDGEVVDSSADGEPLEYLHGYGEIIPGLEKALQGLVVGDKKEVTIEPDDAYGEYDDESFQLVPLDIFPDDLELEEGMELHMRDSETGQVLQAFVAEVQEEAVLLDLNHPLAGETLIFNVEIVSLRPATDEELDHGHVHGAEHHH